VDTEPEATGILQDAVSSSSEENSITSEEAPFDLPGRGDATPSKLKSSLNCVQENPGSES